MIDRLGYLRAGAVAKPYGVSQRTVRRWIAAGVLPSIKIGGMRLRRAAATFLAMEAPEKNRADPGRASAGLA
jgi:excisionase family DNA binding protein